MNDILDNLFYKEKLGIGNKTTFIKKVRDRHPEIKVKDIQDYIKNQEVSQINTTLNKTYQYKITAPPRTFQIDIFWWKRGDTLTNIITCRCIKQESMGICINKKQARKKG